MLQTISRPNDHHPDRNSFCEAIAAAPSIDLRRLRAVMALNLDYVASHEFKLKKESEILTPIPTASRTTDHNRCSSSSPFFSALYGTEILSHAEICHLFRQMNYLKWKAFGLREALSVDSASPKQLSKIEHLYKQSLIPKHHLIESNLRLVVSIAKRYMTPQQTLDDLISDGVQSLLKAVQRFDYTQDFHFTTYASRAVSRNFCRDLTRETSRTRRFVTGCDVAIFHAAVNQKNADERPNGALYAALATAMELANLTPREATTIAMRYGLNGSSEPCTLRLLGERLGVSAPIVAKIERSALSKLKAAAERAGLGLDEFISPDAPLATKRLITVPKRGGKLAQCSELLEQNPLYRQVLEICSSERTSIGELKAMIMAEHTAVGPADIAAAVQRLQQLKLLLSSSGRGSLKHMQLYRASKTGQRMLY